jgi:cytochrome c oxidase accessory protein FixG
VVVGAVLTIAFITAVWGRAWCGWACPQTVFVEQVFRRVERWIEGDALTRKRLDQGPLSAEKLFKKFLKWLSFIFLSLFLSHSFLAYFVGTQELGRMMGESPAQNPTSFLLMGAFAALVLFDFGWFREQFCTVACPYGRFQSVLMDEQSSVVAYDLKRGEPRRKPAISSDRLGQCVNCYRCVQVCPTGIDIRRGVQLECIACTACMDACDEVMSRIKKPLGLIRYGTQSLTEGKTEIRIPWFKRTRAWIYLVLIFVCLFCLVYTVTTRTLLETTFIRATDYPYQVIPDATGKLKVLNHFKVDLRNQSFEEQEISFELTPAYVQKGIALVISNHKAVLKAGEPERADLFVQFPKEVLKMGKAKIQLQIISRSDPTVSQIKEVSLVGPLR